MRPSASLRARNQCPPGVRTNRSGEGPPVCSCALCKWGITRHLYCEVESCGGELRHVHANARYFYEQ